MIERYSEYLIDYFNQNKNILLLTFDREYNILEFNENFENEFNILSKNSLLKLNEYFDIDTMPLISNIGSKLKPNIFYSKYIDENLLCYIYALSKNYILIAEKSISQIDFASNLGELTSELAKITRKLKKDNLKLKKSLTLKSIDFLSIDIPSIIAHQWKQPLNTIATLSQMLQIEVEMGSIDEKNTSDTLTQITKQIFFMSQTMDDFRSFFSKDKVKVDFNIKEAIKSVIELLSYQFKKFKIKVILNGKDSLFFGYENEFKQVIFNLLNNAREAINLKKSKSEKEFQAKIVIDILNTHSKVSIHIKDNGIGIDNETLEHIFKPNFTTKIGGNGIGLYISKEIITKHINGLLKAKASSEGGEFIIELKNI